VNNFDDIKRRYGIVGHNARLINAIEVSMTVAPTEVTVLIQGENGTGKDVFSRIIHQFSKRKHMPFIAINCGAIPEGTMDSELFGHEKGSFTSAYEARKGYFEEVNGGTIFLDEIAEMPLATQSRLLRVLENGEYLRVGSSKVRKTDVRLIAATNKNLIELIRMGRFREDLYFRMNTVSIVVPPLRERSDDIPLLFNWFAAEFSEKYHRVPLQLTPEAAAILRQYRWPGNVREIRNFAEKLTVLVPSPKVDEEVLSQHLDVRDNYLPTLITPVQGSEGNVRENAREIEILYKLMFDLREEVSELRKMMLMGINQPGGMQTREPALVLQNDKGEPINSGYNYAQSESHSGNTPALLEEPLSLEKKEKEMIDRALRKYKDNRKKAAQELGISERTLYRKIKYYNID
jgi:transcriptional regulator with PAS, ATPase and Fis domain